MDLRSARRIAIIESLLLTAILVSLYSLVRLIATITNILFDLILVPIGVFLGLIGAALLIRIVSITYYELKGESSYDHWADSYVLHKRGPLRSVSFKVVGRGFIFYSIKWVWFGILFLAVGIFTLLVSWTLKDQILTDVSYFVLGVGSSTVISEIRSADIRKRVNDPIERESVREQCYAWMFGGIIAINAFFPPPPEKAQVYLVHLKRLMGSLAVKDVTILRSLIEGAKHSMSEGLLSWNKYLEVARIAIGNEYLKFDFFRAAFSVVSLAKNPILYEFDGAASPDGLSDLEKAERKYVFTAKIRGLWEHNNPIIYLPYIERLLKLQSEGNLEGVLMNILSVEDNFLSWYNLSPQQDSIELFFPPYIG